MESQRALENESRNEQDFTMLSLFSGCGGLDLGFEAAGFHCIFASDILPQAGKTYELNFPKTPFILKDIRLLTSDEIKSIIGDKKIDIIIGGPPCQGFSNMGNKNSADPRNYLFEDYVRIVNEIRPKCFLFENVKGFLTMFEGRFFEKVVNAFLAIGYNIFYAIIDSSDYGVPQKRQRIIVFGTTLGNNFKFPKHDIKSFRSLKAYSNVGDAINDLVNKENQVPNHIPLNHSERVVRRYRLIPEGGKLPKPENLPVEIRRGNFGNTYTRLNRDDLSSTIVPGNNALPVHPILDRSLTPREAARIQTFPDTFILDCDRRSQCILIGNAVPPLLAAKLGLAVSCFLRGIDYDGVEPEGIAKTGNVFSKNGKGKSLKMNRATLKFADLFCGAGGFTRGLENAGLKCVLGVDNDPYAVKVYRTNNKSHECLQLDLSSAENQKIVIERLKTAGVQLVVGGPPCQGFSIFGKRRFINTRQHDLKSDKRNNLVMAFANIVREVSPDWFIMENVPGIVSARNGQYISEVTKLFEKKYRIEYKIINAADYGVPQKRRRFILYGTKTDLVIPWPKAKFFERPKSWQHEYRHIAVALTDLMDESSYVRFKNHVPPRHSKIVVERLACIREGQKLDIGSLPEHLKNGLKTRKRLANYSHVFKRLDMKNPSATIVPGHNAFPVHPLLNRTLTIREAARLQTFPDDYEFIGPIINQGLQVGNAFPCLVAQVFGERLRTVVNKGWKVDGATNLATYSMLECVNKCR